MTRRQLMLAGAVISFAVAGWLFIKRKPVLVDTPASAAANQNLIDRYLASDIGGAF